MKQYVSRQRRLASLRVFGAVALCLTGACLAILPTLSGDLAAAVERGRQWEIVSSPNASETHDNILNSVTCTSDSNCWAVGYYDSDILAESLDPPQLISQTLIEHWNGKMWKIVKSPNTSSTEFNGLHSVACVSAKDCWAVGGHGAKPLIEHWNGKQWAIVPSPDINNDVAGLSSVTCLSHSDCWAVGQHGSPLEDFGHTLVIRWDGTFWRVVDSPNSASDQSNALFDVACVTKGDCRAVGIHNTGYITNTGFEVIGSDATLTEGWDGSSWSIVASPNATTEDDNDLLGIACQSALNCWAVGSYAPGNNVIEGNPGQTLIERWNGNSWVIDSSPSNPRTGSLASIACVSPFECWTVGEKTDNYQPTLSAMNVTTTLIERWDGNSWAVVPSPNVSGAYLNQLQAVACVSSECWAVGEYTTTGINLSNVSRTLIEHYTAGKH